MVVPMVASRRYLPQSATMRLDVMTMLARRFNLTVGELQAANPHVLREEGMLRTGDRLLVPTGVAIQVGSAAEYYTVQAGDTWADIARRFGLPLRLLQTVNPTAMRPYFLLKPGDQLFVPTPQQVEGLLH